MTKILIDLATVQQALVTLENVNPSLVCEMAHHSKKDQHGIGQKCPLEIRHLETIAALKAALPPPVQEPVAYDKTEMNSFVIDLYEEKMKEGKHGHYEALFHCVHQAIKRAAYGIKE